jgi:hypothetical protein
MSDNENKSSSAWTDEAKVSSYRIRDHFFSLVADHVREQYNFLLRVVAQLKEEGKQINWQKFDMPGRTTKSLQNQWTKINKQILEVLEEGKNAEASGAASTPARKVATRMCFPIMSFVVVFIVASDLLTCRLLFSSQASRQEGPV